MTPTHGHPENSPEFAGLTVNSGVAQPPAVNPYLKPRRRTASRRPPTSWRGFSKATSRAWRVPSLS